MNDQKLIAIFKEFAEISEYGYESSLEQVILSKNGLVTKNGWGYSLTTLL